MANFDEAVDVLCRRAVIISVALPSEHKDVSHHLVGTIKDVLETEELEKREAHVRRNAHLLVALLKDAEIDETSGGAYGVIARWVREELGKPPASLSKQEAA